MTLTSVALVVELFAGPGGWDVAAAKLGLTVIGLELNADACRTRRAAGHLTIRADVAKYPPHVLSAVRANIAKLPTTPL